jgi:hypothetical protein
MRTILRLSALTVVVLSLALWFFGGPNLGRTKGAVSVAREDPVTGQRVQVRERRFLPGVDFLGISLAAAALLFGGSWAFRGRPSGAPAGERRAGAGAAAADAPPRSER